MAVKGDIRIEIKAVIVNLALQMDMKEVRQQLAAGYDLFETHYIPEANRLIYIMGKVAK